ncbi:hypothetical protein H4582DRAFT_2060786 [Lactarius indigo]|nr:hypothetical protein H4582DRAFT_2060786 [Lactarius indigo]
MTLRSQLSVDYTTTVAISPQQTQRQLLPPQRRTLSLATAYKNENIFDPHTIQSSDRCYFLSIAALDPIGVYGNTWYYIGVTLEKRTQRRLKPELMAFQWLNEAVIGTPSTSWRRWVTHEEDSPPHTCY